MRRAVVVDLVVFDEGDVTLNIRVRRNCERDDCEFTHVIFQEHLGSGICRLLADWYRDVHSVAQVTLYADGWTILVEKELETMPGLFA